MDLAAIVAEPLKLIVWNIMLWLLIPITATVPIVLAIFPKIINRLAAGIAVLGWVMFYFKYGIQHLNL